MKKLKDNLIYLIIGLGFVLRLININQSLWLDEAINVMAAKDLSFWHFVTGYPIGDFHPPGYFAILWIWERVFGISEVFVRMPSVLFGVATIYLIFLIGREMFDKKTAIIAAFFLALNPLHIYYSQEARMYALAAFSGTLSFYFLLKLLNHEKKFIIFYAFSIALVLYSDYLAYLILPAQLIYVLWTERKKIVKILIGQLIGFAALIPWLFIFPLQLINGQQTAQNVPGWQKVVGGSSLKNFLLVYIKSVIGRVTLDNKFLYAVILSVLGIFYSVLTFISLKKINRRSKLLFCWVFLTTILAMVISLFIPVLSFFRMLFIVPGLCLILASGVENVNKKFKIVVLGLILLTSIICLGAYYLNPVFQRENWRGLKSFVDRSSYNQKIIIFENNDVPAPMRYYLSQSLNQNGLYLGGLATFPAAEENDIKDFSWINQNSTIYLVDYLVEISDPERLIDKRLTSLGWRVNHIENIPSLGLVYEYTKYN